LKTIRFIYLGVTLMKLQQLQVFVTVAQEKSLRAAARRLELTQPAVTRTIQELENDVGVALLNRSVQGIELTDYGAALQIRAHQLLEDVRRAREELDQMKGEMCGRVSFGTTSSIALTLLPPTVQRFRETAPTAELVLSEVKFPLALHHLRDGSVDFVASHVLPNMLDDDLISIPLFSTDFVVMARVGHPLAHARRLVELTDAEWLQPIPAEGFQSSVMAAAFERNGLALPRRLTQCASFAIALGLVSDTDIIGLFSRPLAGRVAHYGLQPIMLDVPLPALEMSVIMRKNVRLTPAAQHFMTCLQACARTLATQLAA